MAILAIFLVCAFRVDSRLNVLPFSFLLLPVANCLLPFLLFPVACSLPQARCGG